MAEEEMEDGDAEAVAVANAAVKEAGKLSARRRCCRMAQSEMHDLHTRVEHDLHTVLWQPPQVLVFCRAHNALN